VFYDSVYSRVSTDTSDAECLLYFDNYVLYSQGLIWSSASTWLSNGNMKTGATARHQSLNRLKYWLYPATVRCRGFLSLPKRISVKCLERPQSPNLYVLTAHEHFPFHHKSNRTVLSLNPGLRGKTPPTNSFRYGVDVIFNYMSEISTRSHNLGHLFTVTRSYALDTVESRPWVQLCNGLMSSVAVATEISQK
jgi:hypothetical protein